MSKHSLSFALAPHINKQRTRQMTLTQCLSHSLTIRKYIYINIYKIYLKLNICMIMYMSVSFFAHLFESFDLPQWLNVPFLIKKVYT